MGATSWVNNHRYLPLNHECAPVTSHDDWLGSLPAHFHRRSSGCLTAAAPASLQLQILRISNDYFIIGPTDDGNVSITFSFTRPEKYKLIKLSVHPNIACQK